MKKNINIFEDGCFYENFSSKNNYLFFWKEKNMVGLKNDDKTRYET